jgi:hypothetical protein
MPRTKMSDGVRVQLTTEEENIIIAEEAESKLRDEKYLKVKYKDDRKMAYDPIPEQLDQIFHDIDGWKKRIKAVKEKYPKP